MRRCPAWSITSNLPSSSLSSSLPVSAWQGRVGQGGWEQAVLQAGQLGGSGERKLLLQVALAVGPVYKHPAEESGPRLA